MDLIEHYKIICMLLGAEMTQKVETDFPDIFSRYCELFSKNNQSYELK